MVAGVVLVVLIQQDVSGSDDEAGAQLLRSPAVLVLHIPGQESPRPRPDLSGRQQGHRADGFRPHNLGGGAVLVE